MIFGELFRIFDKFSLKTRFEMAGGAQELCIISSSKPEKSKIRSKIDSLVLFLKLYQFLWLEKSLLLASLEISFSDKLHFAVFLVSAIPAEFSSMSHNYQSLISHLNFGCGRSRRIIINAFIWKHHWFFLNFFRDFLDLFMTKMIYFLPQCCICCLYQGLSDIFHQKSALKRPMEVSWWFPGSPDLIQHIVGPVKSFEIDLGVLVQKFFFVCLLWLYIYRMIN